MSNEIFVDGICEADDSAIQSYFSRFGSRISSYESHRHRATNSCCFALLSFVSPHTVNAVLRHRPHSINDYPLFVKRLLPSNVCSFTERLLPVSSLFAYKKSNKELNEETLKSYFESYGNILKYEYDSKHVRLLIEYDDYDSVDRIFLQKDLLPHDIDIHKNILPRAQSAIEYHGTCRRKQQRTTTDKKKKKHRRLKKHLDDQYQDLLQKTIENLATCKAELRNKENDYVILQIEYMAIKEKLNLRNSCLSCKEHEVTIGRLQQTLMKLNEQYDTIKLQYQRLLLTQYTPTMSVKSTTGSVQHHQGLLLARIYNDENSKYEASENSLRQFNQPTPGYSDIVTKQQNSPSPIIRSRIQQHRTTYKYDSVKNDDE